MIQAVPQTASLSQVHKDATSIDIMLKDGPIMMMRSSSSFGMLVSIEQWNQIAAATQKVADLEETIELLMLEIDRLNRGEEDGDFDIEHLERLAGRVPA